jgi:hypothetical protein
MAQYAVGPQVTQVWTGLGPVLLANQDLTNTVTVGDQPNVFQGAQNADAIPALGSIAYSGYTPLYAIAPAGTAALLVVSGGTSWAPSPAQVALQIQALGLAKDTSVQQVKTTLGTPAQDGTVSGLPSNLQTMGIPSFIPNLASATQIGVNAQGPTTFKTFGANSRIWYALLSFTVAVNSTFSASTTRVYARILAAGIQLPIVELSVANPNQHADVAAPLVINGLPVANGQTLQLDVNNGTSLGSQGVMSASCTVLYSTP